MQSRLYLPDLAAVTFFGSKIPAEVYGIPYRALLIKGMENLLVVGKAISATHPAQSAVRVQPIVSQMGQAAGTAAALAVAKNTTLRSIDVSELQAQLKAAGMLKPADSYGSWP